MELQHSYNKVADLIWDSTLVSANTFNILKNREDMQKKYPNASVNWVHCPKGWFISIRFINEADEAEFIMKEAIDN